MRIGLFLEAPTPLGSAHYVTTIARSAEEQGITSLWVGEHVVLFDEYTSTHPYAPGGRPRRNPEHGILDPFQLLSFIAARTDSIRLGTAICILPQRNPVLTAKAAATLDWLSGGRFDFGIGVGWSTEEYAALAVPWERRATRTSDYVAVMKALWTESHSQFSGELYQLPVSRMYPKPLQHPHPPLYVGGESDAALKRVARWGDGWFGFNVTVDAVAPALGRLGGLCHEHARDRSEIDVTIGLSSRPSPADVRAYADAGVDQLVLTVGGGSLDTALDEVAWIATEATAIAA